MFENKSLRPPQPDDDGDDAYGVDLAMIKVMPVPEIPDSADERTLKRIAAHIDRYESEIDRITTEAEKITPRVQTAYDKLLTAGTAKKAALNEARAAVEAKLAALTKVEFSPDQEVEMQRREKEADQKGFQRGLNERGNYLQRISGLEEQVRLLAEELAQAKENLAAKAVQVQAEIVTPEATIEEDEEPVEDDDTTPVAEPAAAPDVIPAPVAAEPAPDDASIPVVPPAAVEPEPAIVIGTPTDVPLAAVEEQKDSDLKKLGNDELVANVKNDQLLLLSFESLDKLVQRAKKDKDAAKRLDDLLADAISRAAKSPDPIAKGQIALLSNDRQICERAAKDLIDISDGPKPLSLIANQVITQIQYFRPELSGIIPRQRLEKYRSDLTSKPNDPTLLELLYLATDNKNEKKSAVERLTSIANHTDSVGEAAKNALARIRNVDSADADLTSESPKKYDNSGGFPGIMKRIFHKEEKLITTSPVEPVTPDTSTPVTTAPTNASVSPVVSPVVADAAASSPKPEAPQPTFDERVNTLAKHLGTTLEAIKNDPKIQPISDPEIYRLSAALDFASKEEVEERKPDVLRVVKLLADNPDREAELTEPINTYLNK